MNFKDRCWTILHNNLIHSIDELYDLCDEEADILRCVDIINVLQESARDFAKLTDKIRAQKSFDGTHPSAISWEVRKPRHCSPSLLTTTSKDYYCHDDYTNMDSHDRNNKKTNLVVSPAVESTVAAINKLNDQFKSFSLRHLRPEAEAFIPKEFKDIPKDANPPISSLPPSPLKTQPDADMMTSPPLTPIASPLETSPILSNIRPIDIGRSYSDAAMSVLSPTKSSPRLFLDTFKDSVSRIQSPASKSTDVHEKFAKLAVKSPPSRRSKAAEKAIDESDLEVCEVVLAREEVWKEAEAWVDAEAALEDAAWDQLHQEPANFNQDKTLTLQDDSPFLDDDILQSNSPSSSRCRDESSDASMIIAPSAIPSTPPSHRPDGSQTFSRSSSTAEFLKSTSVASSPSLPTIVNLSGLSLHVKLSSPDRRKVSSPTDLKRRADARLTAAAVSRDKNVAEKKMKAVKFLTRVHEHKMKVAQKLAQAEQQLEDKLKDASKRHGEHIRTVRGKANNENTKVSEVIFINSLNADEVAAQLQRRLAEVEARVLAATLRRKERLEDITTERQRRNSRKSQQMSALRLSIERQQMERWSKLQERLQNVQTRREIRLQELQRRASIQQANQSAVDEEYAGKSSAEGVFKRSPSTQLLHQDDVGTSQEGDKVPLSLERSVKNRQELQKNIGIDENDVFEAFSRDLRIDRLKDLRRHVLQLWKTKRSDGKGPGNMHCENFVDYGNAIESAFELVDSMISRKPSLAARNKHLESVGLHDDVVDESKVFEILKNFYREQIERCTEKTELEVIENFTETSNANRSVWTVDRNANDCLSASTLLTVFVTLLNSPTLTIQSRATVLGLLLGREIGLLSPLALKNTLSQPVLLSGLTEVLVWAKLTIDSEGPRQLLIAGLGPRLVDLTHIFAVLSENHFNGISEKHSNTVKRLENEFDETINASLDWLVWCRDFGEVFGSLASILSSLVISDSSLASKDAQATLRWYCYASGMVNRIVPLLQLLKLSSPTIGFVLTAVLSPLNLNTTKILDACETTQGISHTTNPRSSRSTRRRIKSKSTSMNSRDTKEGRYFQPWNTLALALNNLILAATATVRDTTTPRYYHQKEISSLLRTCNIGSSLISLLGSVTTDFFSRCSHRTGSEDDTRSLVGESSSYTWSMVEAAVLPSSRLKEDISATRISKGEFNASFVGYSTRLLMTISILVEALNNVAEVDESIVQNLSADVLSLLSITGGAVIVSLLAESRVDSSSVTAKRGAGHQTPIDRRSPGSHKTGSNTPTSETYSPSVTVKRPVSTSGAMLSETELCICRLLTVVNRIALRRHDNQQIFCSTYGELLQRVCSSTNFNKVDSSIMNGSITLEIQNVYHAAALQQSNDQRFVEFGKRSLLRDLCSLPGKYFNEERFKHFLLPTLIAMTLDCDNALMSLRHALSLSLLTTYLSKLSRVLQETQRDEGGQDGGFYAQIVDTVSRRLPIELWSRALDIYSTYETSVGIESSMS